MYQLKVSNNEIDKITDKYNNSNKINLVSWSGGKDSTATIVLAHELGIRIDYIAISLLWFDKKRKISAEHPEMYRWIVNTAIPTFEKWGYKVEVLYGEKDYVENFYHIITKSKVPERNGKLSGWLLGGMCGLNKEKTKPLERYKAKLGNSVLDICGIATDEPERLERLVQRGAVSLLADLNVVEEDTYEILKPYNLLAPTYKYSRRGGCWFCPNSRIEQFAHIKQNYPELWSELQNFDKAENKASEGFKYGRTFKEVQQDVDAYLSQITLFHLIDL